MKKKIVSTMLVAFVVFSCVAPMSSLACDEEMSQNIEISVEYNDANRNLDLLANMVYLRLNSPGFHPDVTVNSLFPLDSFEVGVLTPNQTYQTSAYDFTKSTIKVGMQSLNSPSKYVKVTLKRIDGTVLGAKIVTVPKGVPLMAPGIVTVTFSNVIAGRHMILIQNLNTENTGYLLCDVRES